MRKSENTLNFSQFQDFLVYTSIFIYSKPPKDLSHLIPALSLSALIEHFKAHSDRN